MTCGSPSTNKLPIKGRHGKSSAPENVPLSPRPLDAIMQISSYKQGEARLPTCSRAFSLLQLAANENALGPAPGAVEAVRQHSKHIHRYPDGNCRILKEKLGDKFKLPAKQLVVGAGSDELISLLINAYAETGDEVIYCEHGFLMYAISTRAAGATPVKASETRLKSSVKALLGCVNERTRLVFIANPNNPTGSYLNRDELAELHAGLPKHVLLVIDGAYAEFADEDDYSDGSDLVSGNANVMMLRTFSKIYGLAALRVGWGYGPLEIVDVMERVRGPFNVSSLAQAAAIASLEDEEHFEASRALVLDARTWVTQQLKNSGLEVRPSLGNFVLVKFAVSFIQALVNFLKKYNILVRCVDAYGLPDYLRITIGRRIDMERVVLAIQEFLTLERNKALARLCL